MTHRYSQPLDSRGIEHNHCKHSTMPLPTPIWPALLRTTLKAAARLETTACAAHHRCVLRSSRMPNAAVSIATVAKGQR